MKVLVVCQHYWPENFRITEICEALAARGHDVTAVVGLPNYPSGVVPQAYRHRQNRKQERNGVHIRRVWEVGRKNTRLGLAINYVSYMVAASARLLTMRREFDVVYAYSTSPVLMSLPAALLRCFSRKKLLLYVVDIWPACLAAVNVAETAPLYRFMKHVSRWVYRKADRLVYSSQRFRSYFHTVHGIQVPPEDYLPQFADSQFDTLPDAPQSELCNLVFAGNIGKVQGVETLIRAAALLLDAPIRWHILGDGANLPACKALAASLGLEDIVTFYGHRPLAEMPLFYAMANAMLVSMRNDVSVNDTLPGKVQSYMAAGKPILGSIAGETPLILAEAACGLCAPPDDAPAFAAVVRAFLARGDRAQMGENARHYYERNFTKTGHMDRLEAMLLELAGGSHEGA